MVSASLITRTVKLLLHTVVLIKKTGLALRDLLLHCFRLFTIPAELQREHCSEN
jgi:hypothetical protein